MSGRHHFFTDPLNLTAATAVLTGGEAHHAAKVLRVRPGEPITVADGLGRVAGAVVTTVRADVVEAGVQTLRHADPTRPALTLMQAVMKGERMDLVVQKAVEIGAVRIVPFVAERSVVRWDDARAGRARTRWEAIALAAAKQSRSAWRTEVTAVAPGPAGGKPGESVVVLHERAEHRLRAVLPQDPPDRMTLVVGPEGGLTDTEVRALEAAGSVAAGLGDRILRTETAGVVGLALIAYAYGTLG